MQDGNDYLVILTKKFLRPKTPHTTKSTSTYSPYQGFPRQLDDIGRLIQRRKIFRLFAW